MKIIKGLCYINLLFLFFMIGDDIYHSLKFGGVVQWRWMLSYVVGVAAILNLLSQKSLRQTPYIIIVWVLVTTALQTNKMSNLFFGDEVKFLIVSGILYFIVWLPILSLAIIKLVKHKSFN